MIDITKKVIAVVRHIETDDITQTKKLAIASFFGYSIAKHMHTWRGIAMHTLHTCHSIVSSPLHCKRSPSEERQKRREKRAMVEKKNWNYCQPENGYQQTDRERQETRGKWNSKIKEVNAKYRTKKEGINLVIEELKQRLIAKKTKVKRYEQKISWCRQKLTIPS